MSVMPAPGTVYIVGAGPGAPDLITVRGQVIIAAADLVLYADSLVEEEVAQLARKPDVRIIATSGLHLEQIVPLMVAAASEGQVVARVHSGDPALYGATHEQMAALRRAGVPYDVVPGVPSAFAAAARLGVELTVPELAQTIILTRAAGRVAMPVGEELSSLAAHGTTLAIHLSVTRMRQVVADLLVGGRYTPQTPVAVLHRVSWPDESMVTGTLADIVERVRAAGYTRQAVILVGPTLTAIDRAGEVQAVSHLYDKTYTHRFRRAQAEPEAAAVTAPPAKPAVESVAPHRGGAAVITLSRQSVRIGGRIATDLGAELVAPAKFAEAGQAAYSGSVLDEIRRQWPQRQALILVLATGVAVRAIAPLLGAKASDPAVICLDEAGSSVIPLLGGHQASANELARRIAAITGGNAAITTASDVQQKPALDQLGHAEGWRIDPTSALTHASACLVNGEPIGVYIDPALTSIRTQADAWLAQADNLLLVEQLDDLLRDDYAAGLIISHRALGEAWLAAQHKAVLYRPLVLVAGIGCRRGVPAGELKTAIEAALTKAELARESLVALASAELKADEPGLCALADSLGVPLRIVPHAQLAALDPAQFSPSAATERFDLPGVAEPCAVLVSGGELIVRKRAFARCTVALALADNRRPAFGDARSASTHSESVVGSPWSVVGGQLSLVGIGPGDIRQMTLAAREALAAADIVTGYHVYIDQIRSLLSPHQELIVTPAMGNELGRAQEAVERAASGRHVALVSSGDIGIYAMAGPVFEVLRSRGWQPGDAPEVQVYPGVSAFQAVAARLGAPLTHDFCAISLSDLLTPWHMITRRIQAAAEADFVIAFYNPRSRERHWQLNHALKVLRAQRSSETPVAFARNVTRPDEQITLTTLAEADATMADMFTLVLVGNRQTFTLGTRMATPRGYADKPHQPAADPPAAHDSASTAATYPISLTNLRGAPVVVVGGGPVGTRKVNGLLAVGAAVRLVSLAATEELRDLAAAGRITWTQRGYTTGDLVGARLVFAATSQRTLNAAVAGDAAAHGILCNVVDAPDEGSFHLPAVYRGPQATIAVSTSGANPAGAKQLRDRIARWMEGSDEW